MKTFLLMTSVSLLFNVSSFAGDSFTPGKYSCVYQQPDPQESTTVLTTPLTLQASENGFMGINSKKAVILWDNQALDPTKGSLGSIPDAPGDASVDQLLEGQYKDPTLHFTYYRWGGGLFSSGNTLYIDNKILSGGATGRVQSIIADGNYDNPGGTMEQNYICTREP